jgi:hypothetical protein
MQGVKVMIDRIIKVLLLVGLIAANTLLLGISYKLDVIIERLNKIELINDIAVYK